MDITLLGTGSPLPGGDRCGGSQIIQSGDDIIAIDMGWGSARRLISLGLQITRVNTIFFTHMHSDHITDVPDFVIMRWAMGATKPLRIFGPDGTRRMADGFFAALQDDIRFRFAHHGEKMSREGIEYEVTEVPATPDARHVADEGGISVSAFEVDHTPVKPAFGFKVHAGGKTVVFSGDTMPVQSLVDAAKGADALIGEAAHGGLMQDRIDFLRSRGDERNAEIMEEARAYHISTLDMAKTARDAGVPRLILTHLIPPIPNDDAMEARFIEGMSDVFKGAIEVGRDLKKFTIA